MKEEIWKDIEGYEGYYQISNMGRVKSLERTVWKGKGYRIVPEKILEGVDNGHGYLQVNLSKDGKVKQPLVHRLVATAFLENPMGYKEINHRDENKENNRAENLEWCSRSYNLTYNGRAKKVGKKAAEKLRGRKHSEETIKKISEKLRGRKFSEEHKKKISESKKGSKLSEETIKKRSKPVFSVDKESGLIMFWKSAKEAERCTGIYHGSIIRCCRGERNSAGNHIWFYADNDDDDNE